MSPGFYKAVHKFGRSELYRIGDLHFIRWQRTNVRDIHKEIMISAKHYEQIKKMLSSIIIKTTVSEITERSNFIIYKHKSTPKAYQRVRRFLVKFKYLKEE